MGNSITKIASFVGADAVLRVFNRAPRILFWHGVDHKIDSKVELEICEISVFEKQIDYLKKHFEIVSIEEFEQRYNNNSFTNNEIVLTFDDGYANNLHVVEPILSGLGLPFTVFVSTDHIENGWYYPTSVNRIITLGSSLKKLELKSENLNFDLSTQELRNNAFLEIKKKLRSSPVDNVKIVTNELINNLSENEWLSLQEKYKSVKPMTWDEVKVLSEKGVTIASHCKWHTCCHENQQTDVVRAEIEESKAIIENHLNKQCNYFAYPTGNYTDFSNDIVRNAYNMGFSTKRQISAKNNRDRACVPRIGVPTDYNTFKFMINLYPKK